MGYLRGFNQLVQNRDRYPDVGDELHRAFISLCSGIYLPLRERIIFDLRGNFFKGILTAVFSALFILYPPLFFFFTGPAVLLSHALLLLSTPQLRGPQSWYGSGDLLHFYLWLFGLSLPYMIATLASLDYRTPVSFNRRMYLVYLLGIGPLGNRRLSWLFILSWVSIAAEVLLSTRGSLPGRAVALGLLLLLLLLWAVARIFYAWFDPYVRHLTFLLHRVPEGRSRDELVLAFGVAQYMGSSREMKLNEPEMSVELIDAGSRFTEALRVRIITNYILMSYLSTMGLVWLFYDVRWEHLPRMSHLFSMLLYTVGFIVLLLILLLLAEHLIYRPTRSDIMDYPSTVRHISHFFELNRKEMSSAKVIGIAVAAVGIPIVPSTSLWIILWIVVYIEILGLALYALFLMLGRRWEEETLPPGAYSLCEQLRGYEVDPLFIWYRSELVDSVRPPELDCPGDGRPASPRKVF